MRPHFCCRMTGRTAHTLRKTPETLTCITRSHSSKGISQNGLFCRVANIAALLISTSIRPSWATAASAIASTDALSPISTATDDSFAA